MNLLLLFWAFLKIGFFGFGGGYAVIPLIAAEVVYQQHWLTASSFGDLLAISQLTPGPIMTNAATFVGYRLNGVTGALLATIASIIPGSAMVLLLTHYYENFRRNPFFQRFTAGLYPVVIALFVAALFFLGQTVTFSWKTVFIIVFCWAILFKKWLNPFLVLVLTAVLGWLL